MFRAEPITRVLCAITVGLPVITVALPAAAVELQGHRGARGLLPENTLPAFKKALALGVDVLELDTVITRDDVVVVHHDPDLSPERTRGPDGNWLAAPGPRINSLSFDELQGYDIGRAKPDGKVAKRFPEQQPVDGTRVPKLADVLALAKESATKDLRFNIETKLSPDEPDATPEPEAFARSVLAVVEQAGLSDRVTIQSFDWRSLRAVNRLAPKVPTVCLSAQRRWLDNLAAGRPGASPWTAGLDIDDYDGSPPRLVQAAGCAIWSPYYRDLTPERLAEAHALGLKVVVWTVNDVSDIKAMAELGVDGIISDYPDRAKAALGR